MNSFDCSVLQYKNHRTGKIWTGQPYPYEALPAVKLRAAGFEGVAVITVRFNVKLKRCKHCGKPRG